MQANQAGNDLVNLSAEHLQAHAAVLDGIGRFQTQIGHNCDMKKYLAYARH
jgi:hypothetical protein